MRFMIMIRANADSEAGKLPSEKLLREMAAYNEQLVKSGVRLAAEGLLPSSKGARVMCSAGGKRKVLDGPFTETKELIAGFWIIQVKSLEEASEWVPRLPDADDDYGEGEIEIRQVFELEYGAAAPDVAKRDYELRAKAKPRS